LEECLVGLHGDPELRGVLAREARLTAESFSYARIAKEMGEEFVRVWGGRAE